MGVVQDLARLTLHAEETLIPVPQQDEPTSGPHQDNRLARCPNNLRAGKYPAREHLKKVVSFLPETRKSNFIFLSGSTLIPLGLSDEFHDFHQESNFYYCTGSNEPDWFLIYDISSSKLTIFVPKPITGRMVAYLGQTQTTEQVAAAYDVDTVQYHDKLGTYLSFIPAIFYTLKDSDLVLALTRARRIKDEYELGKMRIASRVSSQAHLAVAKKLGTHRYRSESQLDVEFRRVCSAHGAKLQAYAPIVGSGKNASVLHYSANDAKLGNSELVLIDAAGSIEHYKSDVTRTYPISGRFSTKGRELYSLVLQMQVESIAMLKPGAWMIDLERHCHSLLSRKLVEWNWVTCNLAKCLELKLSEVFMMHGVGHQIGLDTHDVDVSAEVPVGTQRIPTPLYTTEESFLEIKATRKQAPVDIGNVVTVEPGVYFNEYYLNLFYSNPLIGKYYNQEAIEQWAPLGGVRIEDCVLITKGGSECISNMKKSVEDIEAICSGDGLYDKYL